MRNNINSFSVNDIIKMFNDFKNEHGRFPNSKDCILKNNLVSWQLIKKIIEINDMSISDFNEKIGRADCAKSKIREKYEDFLELYKTISNEIGRPLKFSELTNNTYGLPDSRWFVINCDNPKVKNFNNFIEYEAKMKPRYFLSKESTTKIILDLRKTLNRPLMQSDFSKDSDSEICMSVIKRIWGTFNNMKIDLGLEIVQEDMNKRRKSIDEIKIDIKLLCEHILKTENRTIICTDDWKKIKGIASFRSGEKYFKKNKSSVREFVESIGFKLNFAGTGLNKVFEDSEVCVSQYEICFTKFLRENGFKFNVDYFRDVKYKNFISNYNGLMNCDYMIRVGNDVIYIEIAGLLRDYKSWYYNNKPLNSKSREKYRIKLNQKENMLINSNLKYLILFPCDLNEKNLINILNFIKPEQKEIAI